MEKNKLRLTLSLSLLLLSSICLFAQDNAEANEIGNKEAATEEAVNIKNDSAVSEKTEAVSEGTESIVTEEKNKKATATSIKDFFWDNFDYIIAGLSLLVMAIVTIVLSYLFSRKLIRREIDNLKKDIDETIKSIEQKFNEKCTSIINKPQPSSNMDDMHDKFGILERNISGMQNELSILVELKNKVDTLYSGKRITESITSGNLGVMEAFNLWAVSPYGPLPEAFYYIEGEMYIRTKREIRESAEETKWIANRNGAKKYLFPNPNSFNQMTNIMELYKMDQAKLKGRGQNKIKIITPCEITKDGFVEFAGELQLL